MTVRTLADFKRFLAQPGATVQVVRNDWTTTNVIKPRPGYWEPKRVQKLQTNAVQFTTGGWLNFPKAAHVRFNEDNTLTIDMNEDGTFSQVLVYKLWEDKA